MSKELYLHTLQQIRDGCLAENMDTEAEALEAAIQALSCDGDAVSRIAVFECFDGVVKKDDCFEYIKNVITKIRDLPSAQPEVLAHGEGELSAQPKQECEKCIFRPFKQFQAEQQWIPCSEPPKESGTYIVTAYDGTNKRVSFVKYQKTLKRWDLTGARAYWCILAYKPMPEPWRGEEQ